MYINKRTAAMIGKMILSGLYIFTILHIHSKIFSIISQEKL